MSAGEAIRSEWVEVRADDGTDLGLWVARPEGAEARPGILVFHEVYGVDPHVRDVARRLAGEGYVAAAPDLFHRTAPRFEGSYEDPEAARAQARRGTAEGIAADGSAAYRWLTTQGGVPQDRVGALGFGMGGAIAWRANAGLPLRAAISFYGARIADLLDLAPHLHAPMLLFWGGLDPHVAAGERARIAAALKEYDRAYVECEFSFADHGFFCDARGEHDPAAAAQAWALTRAFLAEALIPGPPSPVPGGPPGGSAP